MSVSNTVERNIEVAKSDLEATIEMKPDEIKSDRRLPRHENIIYHNKQIIFILWTNIYWYLQIATPKTTWQILACITICQKNALHEPWRWHSPSTAIMLGCHSICLLTTPINKQYISGIKISQNSILLSILIFSSVGYPFKVSHRKIKLSIIIKSSTGSPFQWFNYSFVYSTKITRKTYH